MGISHIFRNSFRSSIKANPLKRYLLPEDASWQGRSSLSRGHGGLRALARSFWINLTILLSQSYFARLVYFPVSSSLCCLYRPCLGLVVVLSPTFFTLVCLFCAVLFPPSILSWSARLFWLNWEDKTTKLPIFYVIVMWLSIFYVIDMCVCVCRFANLTIFLAVMCISLWSASLWFSCLFCVLSQPGTSTGKR
jgi:hypothetical protein